MCLRLQDPRLSRFADTVSIDGAIDRVSLALATHTTLLLNAADLHDLIIPVPRASNILLQRVNPRFRSFHFILTVE